MPPPEYVRFVKRSPEVLATPEVISNLAFGLFVQIPTFAPVSHPRMIAPLWID
jgi:hypothetical protein